MKFPIRVVAMLLCSVAMSGKTTKWDFPRPETITKVNCTVTLVNMHLNGASEGYDVWAVKATAFRNDSVLENWEQEIGQFPATLSGRHKAERTCTKWMDEANKQLGWVRK